MSLSDEKVLKRCRYRRVFAGVVAGIAFSTFCGAEEQGVAGAGEGVAVITQTQAADAREEETAVVKERVGARWKALIASDYRAAYELELPSFREQFPLDRYEARYENRPQWLVATPLKVSYDAPEVARVAVEVTVSAVLLSGDKVERETVVREIWLKRDGKWYFSTTK